MRTLTLCLALIAAVGCDRNSKKSDSKPSGGGACTGQPYSPVQAGACTPFDGQPRFAFVDPAGLLGNYCAPACLGVAQTCPDVAGTSAEGKCFFVKDGTQHCAAWCRIDAPAGSAQCPCGATCQPYGPPDDDGNLRGVCLFK